MFMVKPLMYSVFTVLEAAYSAWYRRRARRRGPSCPRHACCRRTAWHSSRTAPMAWRHQAAGSVATAVYNPQRARPVKTLYHWPVAKPAELTARRVRPEPQFGVYTKQTDRTQLAKLLLQLFVYCRP